MCFSGEFPFQLYHAGITVGQEFFRNLVDNRNCNLNPLQYFLEWDEFKAMPYAGSKIHTNMLKSFSYSKEI